MFRRRRCHHLQSVARFPPSQYPLRFIDLHLDLAPGQSNKLFEFCSGNIDEMVLRRLNVSPF